jgi:hypothetical protein
MIGKRRESLLGDGWKAALRLPSVLVAAAIVAAGCGDPANLPRPAMPVKVTVEPHLPDTLDLGVHLKLQSLVDEEITVTVEIESDALRNDPARDDPGIHPIFWGDGPVQLTLAPRATLDFWFARGQLAPEDPIVVTHGVYAAQLVRVPADAGRGPVEAIAIGPVE